MTSHREQYPEQYTHRMVGKDVRIQLRDRVVIGRIERVVSTRFGKLAILEGDSDTAYSFTQIVVDDGAR